MSWIVSREEIVGNLRNHKMYHGDELIIWALYKQGIPGYPKWSPIGGNPAREGMWLAISRKDVKILPVTFVRGKLTETIYMVKNEDIESFTLKKGIFFYKLTIKTRDDRVIKFDIGSKLIGRRDHHEDLMTLMDRLN